MEVLSVKERETALPGEVGQSYLAALRDMFGDRAFRYFWAGQAISLLGDQLYVVALPWLVLRLTGSAFATGTVLALVAVPRATFMLVGGAFADRFSPRVVMLGSNLARLALVTALSVFTLTGLVRFWMLYPFALLFGLADAFFFPAQGAMVPMLVATPRLPLGNAVIQGTAQLAMFVGPSLAGVLIGLLERRTASGSLHESLGIGVALGLDAVTFLASIASLVLMGAQSGRLAPPPSSHKQGVLSFIREGVAAIWHERPLRYYFILISIATFLLLGPFTVGVPVLAHSRYAEGAMAMGTILSSFGAGSLTGIAVAALSPRLRGRAFPAVMLIMCSLLGFGLVLLGLLPALAPAALAAFVMGLAEGFVMIQWITWIQGRTPSHMLGRTMSMLMFAVLGLTPLSNAAAGALLQLDPRLVLVSAGTLIVLVVTVAALSPSVWLLGQDEGAEK